PSLPAFVATPDSHLCFTCVAAMRTTPSGLFSSLERRYGTRWATKNARGDDARYPFRARIRLKNRVLPAPSMIDTANSWLVTRTSPKLSYPSSLINVVGCNVGLGAVKRPGFADRGPLMNSQKSGVPSRLGSYTLA